MKTSNFNITIRFYEELNYFVKNYAPKEDIKFSFKGKRSIKDLIESFGVPHVEVDLILVNGFSVDFNYTVEDGDRISVYPVFESFDLGNIQRLRPKTLRKTKFILDVHLGKLAKNLLILGFDTIYNNSMNDKDLALISSRENRILLTRDRGLLKRKIVNHGFIIKDDNPVNQTIQVLNRVDLWKNIKPFSRCIHCNGLLNSITAQEITSSNLLCQIPDYIFQKYNEFSICSKCKKIYWKGTHYRNLTEKIKKHFT